MDFDTKGIIYEVRVHSRLYLDILDADRSPNAVTVHVGTTQLDFEADRPPPADSSPGDVFITIVEETVILYKKEFIMDFDPKGIISEVRVHAGLYLDILDADRSPNAVRDHAAQRFTHLL